MSRPYAARCQADCRLCSLPEASQEQGKIAVEVDFQNQNFMMMLMNGANMVPIDRVPDLARALEVDPALLIWLSLEQSISHAAAKAALSVFRTPVTQSELQWLNEIRDAYGSQRSPHDRQGACGDPGLFREMSEDMFMLSSHPASISTWEDLTPNERDWIEYIRIISGGRDPAVNLERVRRLRVLMDETRCSERAIGISGRPRSELG